jgi:hypothetical protein
MLKAYIFDRWELDSKTVSLQKSYLITMTMDHLLEVHFHETPAKLTTNKTNNTLSVALESGGGKISISDGVHTYKVGTIVAVKATNTAGYTFDRWVLDGATVSTSLTYTVSMQYNYELEAYFH